jgi:uncharacterized repeat protein (TIGR01451 family)
MKNLLAAGTLLASLSATPALAQGTRAGTLIDNKATATYGTPSGDATIESNTVSLKVDELLDVTIAAEGGDITVSPGATERMVKFTVTNSGNGEEAFLLTANGNAGGDDFNPAVTRIVLDSNGNGTYDEGEDDVYVSGTNDPVLASDTSIAVFVFSTIPDSVTDAQRGIVELNAAAKTGSGTAGTIIAGQGEGGGNAVVGATTASATDSGRFVVSQATARLVKAATVADPFGGTTIVPGSTVTYTLTAEITGSGTLANLRVADAIPADTTYQAGSMTLDGVTLTDASDGDVGTFASGAIAVTLGNTNAGTSRVVAFKVKVK